MLGQTTTLDSGRSTSFNPLVATHPSTGSSQCPGRCGKVQEGRRTIRVRLASRANGSQFIGRPGHHEKVCLVTVECGSVINSTASYHCSVDNARVAGLIGAGQVRQRTGMVIAPMGLRLRGTGRCLMPSPRMRRSTQRRALISTIPACRPLGCLGGSPGAAGSQEGLPDSNLRASHR